jgi:hypothetical protein
MDSGPESRRSARVVGRFWVAVEGVDAELTPRRGDISPTGIFFETEADVGGVGTVQWLHIASADRKQTLNVMAYVVRVVQLSDVQREVRGVALEFMPDSDDVAEKVCDFALYILQHPHSVKETPHIAPRLEVSAGAGATEPDQPATVNKLSVQTLLLETDWSVPVGEPVRVEIIARGVRRPIRVEGSAISVLPAVERGPNRYRIAVEVKNEIVGPLRRFPSLEIPAIDPSSQAADPSTTGPLGELLAALIKPRPEPPDRKHLTGLLSRIPFTTLCSLLELERLTGELTIRNGEEQACLFVRDGCFVDIEPSGGKPRETIGALLALKTGTFAFVVRPVPREDKVGLSMTQLLLDCAREADEANRNDVEL